MHNGEEKGEDATLLEHYYDITPRQTSPNCCTEMLVWLKRSEGEGYACMQRTDFHSVVEDL